MAKQQYPNNKKTLSRQDEDSDKETASLLPLITSVLNEEDQDAFDDLFRYDKINDKSNSSINLYCLRSQENKSLTSLFNAPDPEIKKPHPNAGGGEIFGRFQKPQEGIKTAAIFSVSTSLSEEEQKEFNATLQENLRDVINHRPYTKEGDHTPNKKRPLWVTTPGGTTLNRDGDYGALATYSNKVTTPRRRTLFAEDTTVEKSQSLLVTKEGLEQSTPRKKQRSQQDVMGESAKDAAAKLHLNGEWEWGHLIAYCLNKNQKSQDKSNLTLMSKNANSLMIPFENLVKQCAVLWDEGVTATVQSTQEVTTKLPANVDYNIKTPTIECDFSIESKTQEKPPYYVNRYTKTLGKTIQQRKDTWQKQNDKDTVFKPVLFSDRVDSEKKTKSLMKL